MQRIFFNLAFLAVLLFLPWWFGVIVAVSTLIFIDRMYELIVWGVLFDVIFGVHLENLPLSGATLGIVFCLLSFFIKKRFLMPIYANKRSI